MQHFGRARSALARLLRGHFAFGHYDSIFTDSSIVRAHARLASNGASPPSYPSDCTPSVEASAEPLNGSGPDLHDGQPSAKSRPPSSWQLPAPGTACGRMPGSGRVPGGLRLASGVSLQPVGWRWLATTSEAREERQRIRLHNLVLPLQNPTAREGSLGLCCLS